MIRFIAKKISNGAPIEIVHIDEGQIRPNVFLSRVTCEGQDLTREWTPPAGCQDWLSDRFTDLKNAMAAHDIDIEHCDFGEPPPHPFEDGCGKSTGHGESCSTGWLCSECRIKVKIKQALLLLKNRKEVDTFTALAMELLKGCLK